MLVYCCFRFPYIRLVELGGSGAGVETRKEACTGARASIVAHISGPATSDLARGEGGSRQFRLGKDKLYREKDKKENIR
jgi:hypothetical protein